MTTPEALVAPKRTRKPAIERARTRYTNPHAPYAYPDLPAPADAAFTYYCIYLGYVDGTFLKGPHPAFVKDCTTGIVDSEKNPLQRPKFEQATTPAQQYLLENLKPNLAKDKEGNPLQLPARRWTLVENKNESYYEDPRIAAQAARPFVRKIALYCPLSEFGDSGALEDHGAYLGADAEVPEDHDEPTGACPRCAGRWEKQARALKKISELHAQHNVPLNPALLARTQSMALQTAGRA